MNNRERAALDRHITGNYGEDQFKGVDADEIVSLTVPSVHSGDVELDFYIVNHPSRGTLLGLGAHPHEFEYRLDGRKLGRDGCTQIYGEIDRDLAGKGIVLGPLAQGMIEDALEEMDLPLSRVVRGMERVEDERTLMEMLFDDPKATVVVSFSKSGQRVTGGMFVGHARRNVRPSLVLDMEKRGLLTEVSHDRLHQKRYSITPSHRRVQELLRLTNETAQDVKIVYRGHTIKRKRDFGNQPFWLDGHFVCTGFLVIDPDGQFRMPGAVWFQTVDDAKGAIDVWIVAKTSSDPAKEFWRLLDMQKRLPVRALDVLGHGPDNAILENGIAFLQRALGSGIGAHPVQVQAANDLIALLRRLDEARAATAKDNLDYPYPEEK